MDFMRPVRIQLVLQNALSVDGQQTLRRVFRHMFQPASHAGCDNNGFHGSILRGHLLDAESQTTRAGQADRYEFSGWYYMVGRQVVSMKER